MIHSSTFLRVRLDNGVLSLCVVGAVKAISR
jgi:hypothetical protein